MVESCILGSVGCIRMAIGEARRRVGRFVIVLPTLKPSLSSVFLCLPHSRHQNTMAYFVRAIWDMPIQSQGRWLRGTSG